RYSVPAFAAQVGPERRPVCNLSGESASRRLVLLLSGGRRHDGDDGCLVHFKGVGEMLCNLRRNRASSQHFAERRVARADLPIAETVDKLGPTYRQRSGAVQNEPA